MRPVLDAALDARAHIKVRAGTVVLRPMSLRLINEEYRTWDGFEALVGITTHELPRAAEFKAFDLVERCLISPSRWLFRWVWLRSSNEEKKQIWEGLIELSLVPDDLDKYFKPQADSEKNEMVFGEDPKPKGHWLVHLSHIAVALELSGHPDPLGLSPKQLAWRARHLGDEAGERLVTDAYATRVGQHADEDGWSDFIRSLRSGNH